MSTSIKQYEKAIELLEKVDDNLREAEESLDNIVGLLVLRKKVNERINECRSQAQWAREREARQAIED